VRFFPSVNNFITNSALVIIIAFILCGLMFFFGGMLSSNKDIDPVIFILFNLLFITFIKEEPFL